MGQIYLVRHGQASFGADDYDQLSELGREQARRLGTWLRAIGTDIAAVATGQLRRHRQTADACFAGWLSPTMCTEPRLDEYDFAEVLGRLHPDLAEPEGVRRLIGDGGACETFERVFFEAIARWTEGNHGDDYREPWKDFRRRCVDGLMRLIAGRPPSQTIVVVTSGGPIAAICQHVLGLSDDQAVSLCRPLLNCGVTKLLYRPDRIGLSYLNSVAHLEVGSPDRLLTYR